jgi:hypothetical protein
VNVSGAVFATSCCGSSDRRWKRDIEPLDGVLEQLLRLKGKSYRWRDEAPGAGDRDLQYGFVAQEVQEVFPDLVKDHPDGEHLTLAYQQVIPLLVEGVRELRTEKEAEIRDLRSQIASLEERLASLEAALTSR